MDRFRQAVEARDPEALVASLAENVVFHSPILFRPIIGRAYAGHVLRAVMRVFESFSYADELHSASQTALEFTARVGERELQGIDLLKFDDHGQVVQLTVFVRPLTAAQALAEAVRAELAASAP